jgi:LysR family transcriptional regulator, cyn operon transcriptional activator
VGDTVGLPSMLRARKLLQVAFDPPLYETYAFITRRNARLSPSTRAFMDMAEKALG